MAIPWFHQLWERRRNLGGTQDRGLVPEDKRCKSPGWGARGAKISLLGRGGLWVDACASVQILVLKLGGGQSEVFTVSRRLDPNRAGRSLRMSLRSAPPSLSAASWS